MATHPPRADARSRQLLALVALCFASAVVPVANWVADAPHVDWWPLATRQWAQRMVLLLGVSTLVGLLASSHGARWLTAARRALLRPSPRLFVGVTGLWTATITFVLARYCFANRALSIDEIAQQFHARILLTGGLTVALPPHPAFFAGTNLLTYHGRWSSQFPIGGPALLALGQLVGMSNLVGPLLTAATLAMSFRLLRAVGGELEARMAVLLLALCPFFLFMGASAMNHMPAALGGVWALAAAYDFLDASTTTSRRWHAAEWGAALGGMLLLRPLEALACAAVVALIVGPRAAVDRAAGARALVWSALGMAPFATIMLLNNHAVSGHPFVSGYSALWGAAHGLGFHAAPYGDAHTPLRGIGLVSGYLMRANLYLLEWPVPVFPLLALGVAGLAVWSGRPARQSMLALYALLIVLAYGLYWHNGFYLGPRFIFAAVPVLVYLLTAGWIAWQRRVQDWPRVRLALVTFPLLATVWAWTSTDPLASVQTRAAEYAAAMPSLKFDAAAVARAQGLTHAIVLAREGWGSALMTRVWDAGFSRPEAEGLLAHSDACRLQEALDALPRESAHVSAGQREQIVASARLHGPPMRAGNLTGDATLRFDAPLRLSPSCASQLERDREGILPFQPLLKDETFLPSGALGGDIIYARDLWPRNAPLAADFPGRRWFRFRASAHGLFLVPIDPAG